MDTLTAAQEYAEMGWSVIPLSPSTKKPLIKWREFQDRIAEPEEIEGWFGQWPDAEIGAITGPISNLVVVDCDNDAAIQRVADEGIFSMVQQNTKRGRHILFQHPGYKIKNQANWNDMPNVDVRGDGGYIKVFPSTGYEWHLPMDMSYQDIPRELPEWTFGETGKKELMTDFDAAMDFQAPEKGEKIPDKAPSGQRNQTMTRVVGALIKEHPDKWGADIAKLAWQENLSKCEPPLPKSEIITISKSVMRLHMENNPDEFDDDGYRKQAYMTDKEQNVRDALRMFQGFDAIMLADDPKPREWLVEKIIPAGLPGVLASSGGVGKTYMLMDLAAKVAYHPLHTEPMWMGQRIRKNGKVVMFLYEDDLDELARRMKHIDPCMMRGVAPDQLFMISIPELEKAMNFGTKKFDTPVFTSEADAIHEALCSMDDLALVVFDPLQSFFDWRFDEDNIAADRALKWAQSIAVKTGATVMFTHHLRKEEGISHVPTTPHAAVGKIRGASNIVNSSRFAIPVWRPTEDQAESVKAIMAQKFPAKYSVDANNSVFMAGLGKENFGGDVSTHWLIRDNETGMLEDVTQHVDAQYQPNKKTPPAQEILNLLRDNDRLYTNQEIKEALEMPSATLRDNLKQLLERGRIHKEGRGQYMWTGHHGQMEEVISEVKTFCTEADRRFKDHPKYAEYIAEGLIPLMLIQSYMRSEIKKRLWQEAARIMVEQGRIESIVIPGKKEGTEMQCFKVAK